MLPVHLRQGIRVGVRDDPGRGGVDVPRRRLSGGAGRVGPPVRQAVPRREGGLRLEAGQVLLRGGPVLPAVPSRAPVRGLVGAVPGVHGRPGPPLHASMVGPVGLGVRVPHPYQRGHAPADSRLDRPAERRIGDERLQRVQDQPGALHGDGPALRDRRRLAVFVADTGAAHAARIDPVEIV